MRVLTELGVAVALATVLGLTRIWRMPLGGSVTAGSMVPLWIVARRHGAGAGLQAGTAFGLLQAMQGTVVHPVQGILDYLLAYQTVALAAGGLAGAAAGLCLRLAAHVAAALVFFREVPSGWTVPGYALAYNAGFLVPDGLLALLAWSWIGSRWPGLGCGREADRRA